MSLDSQARSRLRSSLSSGSPEEQARVLVDRMRAVPLCKACGGSGLGMHLELERDWEGNVLPQAARRETCRPCAGTGSPFRARVELAAYCGSEAAMRAMGWELVSPRPTLVGLDVWRDASGGVGSRAHQHPFPAWVSGLSRWGQEAQVRAAVAAAEPAREVWVAGLPLSGEASAAFAVDHLHLTRAAIEAAKAWLECPCAAHGDAWSLLFSPWFDMWVPVSVMAIERDTPLDHGHTTTVHGIRRAAEVAGEPAVRSAIQSSLIAFALGDS